MNYSLSSRNKLKLFLLYTWDPRMKRILTPVTRKLTS